MTRAKKREVVEGKAGLVSDDDRALILELARQYLGDRKHPAVQRWAWEKVLPYALPRLSSSELKGKDGEGFKILVEDYRSKAGEVVEEEEGGLELEH